MTFDVEVLSSCESEIHLVIPVMDELISRGITAKILKIPQNDLIGSYSVVEKRINQLNGKIDLILSVADRTEQLGGVLAAFHNKIKIGQLYAGDLNTISTYDDIHRHSISLYSDILFCSCFESAHNISKMRESVGLQSKKIYVVGATHFDGIDMNCITTVINNEKPYILILINSETLGDDEQLISEVVYKLNIILSEFKNRYSLPYVSNKIKNIILVEGNGDNSSMVNKLLNKLPSSIGNKIQITYKPRLDHLSFLSILKDCKYFITNSSSIIYEAPMLIKSENIIQVGKRNLNRTKIPKRAHDGDASNTIARIIQLYLKQENEKEPVESSEELGEKHV